MKYFLNPDFDMKNDEDKIKYLESIKHDIDSKIDELKKNIVKELHKSNENNIKTILCNSSYELFDDIIVHHKLSKIINKLVLNSFICNKDNNGGNIKICISFFVNEIENKVEYSENMINNVITNELKWKSNKKLMKNENIKYINDTTNKLDKLNQCLKCISKTGLLNLI
jgi:hypothetical protein